MRILGIDPSLNSTGFAYRLNGEVRTGRVVPGTGKHRLTGIKRLQYMRDEVLSLLDFIDPQLVVYEGYAMAGKGKVFHIGELGGVLKVAIAERSIPILEVPPSNLKKFATNKGNADKEQIAEAVRSRMCFDIPHNDEADAFVLMLMGEAKFSNRQMETHIRKCVFRDALNGCEILQSITT